MPTTTKTVTMVVAALLLTAIVGFPLGMDQGMFIHCAKVVNAGGTLYIDAYDIKPPAVHYLYAAALWLPWASDTSIRLFELVWNLATCFLVWHVLRAWPTLVRSLAVLVFASILVASGHPNTAQPESFAALPLLALLWAIGLPTNARTLVYGLALGAIIALKPTMGLAAIPLFAVEWPRSSRASALGVVLVAALAVAATLLPVLVSSNGLHALRLMFEAQRAFGTAVEVGDSVFWLGVTSIARWLLLSVGLALIAAATFAYRIHHSALGVRLAAWVGLALFASILVEHRFHPYHHLRMAAPLAVLAGIGIGSILLYVRRSWSQRRFRWRVRTSTALGVGFLLTCLPLTTHKTILGYGQLFGHRSYEAYIGTLENEGNDAVWFKTIANAVNAYHAERPIILSARAGRILPWLERAHYTRAASTQFVTGVTAPPEWTAAVLNDMQHATLMAVDTADVMPLLTGHRRSTLTSMRASAPFNSLIDSRFKAVDTVHTFIIFRAQP
jgi:hypothetical protein